MCVRLLALSLEGSRPPTLAYTLDFSAPDTVLYLMCDDLHATITYPPPF